MHGFKRWIVVALLDLQEGSAAMALELARFAQKQSELGIAQKDYPLFR